VTTADFAPGSTTGAIAPVRALGFTVGCHAGLNVPDVQVGPTLDWAQLYSRSQTQWIGHTTYGYGDTEIVAYSERLATLFAGNVAAMTRAAKTGAANGAPTSLGAAMRDAKQRYLASTLVISPYDEKILQSWTYYGLPMYSIGEPPIVGTTTTTTDTTTTDTTTTTESAPQGFRTSSLVAAATSGPAIFGDPPLGSGAVPVSIDVSDQLAAPTFDDPDDNPDAGSYYSIDGSIVSAQNRPVQPLVDVAIPGSTTNQFAGFLITGLSSRDLPNTYVPFVSRPTVDNSIDEPRFLAGDVAFPANLQQVTDIGGGQRLLVAAGQWQNVQRLFDRISGELLPRAGNDTDAPRFLDVSGTNIDNVGANGRGVRFDVATDGDATRVVVLFREERTNNWRTLELTGSNGSWFGVAALVNGTADTNAEFFAQSVDAAGNVGITSNKIENFLTIDSNPIIGPVGVTATIDAGGAVGGRFIGDGGTFTIVPSADTTEPATFSIGTGARVPVATQGITIDVVDLGTPPAYKDGVLSLAPGDYLITARFGDGPPTTRFFVIDASGPVLSYSRDTAIWTNPTGSGLVVSANDGSGAGVRDLAVRVTAADAVLQNVTGSDTDGDGVFTAAITPIVVGPGNSARPTVAVTSSDKLDNKTTTTFPLLVDHKGPTVTIEPKSDAWSSTQVDITVTAADTDSGIASVCLTRNAGPCEPIELSGGRYTETIDTQGLTTIGVTATDVVGNETIAEPVSVRIDRTKPTVSVTRNATPSTRGPVTFTVTAADEGSGLATVCVAINGGGCGAVALTNGSFTTAELDIPAGTGTITVRADVADAAGNTNTASASATVDNIAPLVSISPKTTSWSTSPVGITVTASDAESGLASVCLRRNGSTVCGPIALTNGVYTETIPTQGLTSLEVTAADNVGNTKSDSTLVRVDTTAPTVAIRPNDSTWSAGTVEVTLDVADPGGGAASGIASVCVTTTGACVPLNPNSSGGYTTTLTVPTGTAGAPTISATARDVAGNSTTAGPVTVKIDNQAPGLTLGSDQVGTWTNAPVTVTATTDDGTGSGIGVLCLADTCDSTTPKTVVVDPGPGKAIQRTFTATATDMVGNRAAAGPIAVKVDRIAPTATLSVNGLSGIYPVGANVTVTFSCADADSGVARCELLRGTQFLSASGSHQLDTSVPGAASLSVRATDRAGNSFTTASVSVVVGYKVCRDYDPTAAKRVGAAYAITIRLCDANNNTVAAAGITLTALTINGNVDPGPGAPGGSNPSYTFSYSPSTSQFSYTLKTTGLPKGTNNFFFTTLPVPSRNIPMAELQALATNSTPFTLR